MYHKYVKRKEKMIITAIDILDEKGVQGLTTKELAKREGITEPALYRQFDSKNNIVHAMLDKYAIFDGDIINTIMEQKMSPKEGIIFFIGSYASYYESYPQITNMLYSLDLYRYEELANQKMMEIINNRYEFMRNLTAKAKELNEVSSTINTDDLADIILGTLWSSVFIWKLNGCAAGLKDTVMNRTRWLLERP